MWYFIYTNIVVKLFENVAKVKTKQKKDVFSLSRLGQKRFRLLTIRN